MSPASRRQQCSQLEDDSRADRGVPNNASAILLDATQASAGRARERRNPGLLKGPDGRRKRSIERAPHMDLALLTGFYPYVSPEEARTSHGIRHRTRAAAVQERFALMASLAQCDSRLSGGEMSTHRRVRELSIELQTLNCLL